MSGIQPFGYNADNIRQQNSDQIQQIKLFGCTVVDFNVSADWSAQGGSLSCRLIEDESDGDRLQMPVLGSPALFEVISRRYSSYNTDGLPLVSFQYIGIVDSFSRSSSNSKTYSVNLSSPLKILEAATVILDGYVGMGGAIEGMSDFSGTGYQDYGSNNSLINVLKTVPDVYHWWNVSNLINVYGILENDHYKYRFPTQWDAEGFPIQFGGYGYSGRSENGMPLIKLMWALHHGINHVPYMEDQYRQRTAGGNLLYGRHNYQMDLAVNPYGNVKLENAVPYYYHFDALDFYNQVVGKLGPQFRVEGQYKTLRDLIAGICDEANIDWYSYIDIYKDPLSRVDSRIGRQTLQEYDPNWGRPARCSFINMGEGQPANAIFDTRKFYQKLNNGDAGNYGGTIRIATVDKNTYVNYNRPFSNIAYNLIGLEVPDIKTNLFNYYDGLRYNSGIHPGRRPGTIEDWQWGVARNNTILADPLDASGLDKPYEGWRNVGTKTISDGGSAFWNTNAGFITKGSINATGYSSYTSFPVFGSGIFDPILSAYARPKSSDISLKTNDVITMKIVTGGNKTRLVTAPGRTLRHYWGDIILPNASDPRETNDTATDSLGLDEQSTKKIPIVTPLLDPRDVDDYILIDMKSAFGLFTCPGVLKNGVYAASMLEIRCAMSSQESWKAFMEKYKYQKIRNLRDCLYPDCGGGNGNSTRKDAQEAASETINLCGGLGYVGTSHYFGVGNTFSLSPTPTDGFSVTITASGAAQNPPHTGTSAGGAGAFGLGFDIPCAVAEINIKKHLLPVIWEKVKEIGDTHYGKSWFAPVPFCQTIEDLDGDNLIGNFKRTWELTNSAYIEPSQYYYREVPQTNAFVSDGKVSPFINYDHNFIIDSKESGVFDKSYQADVTSLIGQETQVFNFSEYDIKNLAMTKYGSRQVLVQNVLQNQAYTYPVTVIHAPPENVDDKYTFLPFMYERIYNRALLPFSEMIKGRTLKWNNYKTSKGVAGGVGFAGPGASPSPISAGQLGTSGQKDYLKDEDVPTVPASDPIAKTIDDNKFLLSSPLPADCPGANPLQISDGDGYFSYDIINGVPAYTQPLWLAKIVPTLEQLDFNDNGRFSFPFVKFTSSRVFLPVPSPASPLTVNRTPSMDGFNAFVGAQLKRNQGLGCSEASVNRTARRQHLITEDEIISVLKPFQACVCPRSFNYAQVSTRYVYGPWMTSFSGIAFRGKVEYEQDDSLVPENFLIPTNFGPFGQSYQLNQTSGFAGMNLAAQGRANAIDNFLLFALEEGTITFPGGPNIRRIGEGIYGIQQVSDLKINVSNDNIETTYTFKTIAPKFGKNTRELEKKLTKISNEIKKLKMR